VAITTFIEEFAPYPLQYRTHFDPATDRYLTPEEQAAIPPWRAPGYDLTKAGYRVEYVGKVLGIYEENGYDDSDFYAYVETAPGVFGRVIYNSTRHAGGGVAEVDATDDVYERFWDYYDQFWAKVAADRERDEATVARVGREVEVTGGRKYKGRRGTVGWVGEYKFARGPHGGTWRMRVDPEEGESFFVSLAQTTLPDHENMTDRIGNFLAEGFRGAPQTRGSKVTAR
jgi:hypothetical protein